MTITEKDVKKLINKEIQRTEEPRAPPKLIKSFLNIKTYLKTHIELVASKINQRIQTQAFKDLITVSKYVLGYGVLGWFCLYTFFGYKFNVLYILGAGSGLYLVYDAIDYIVNSIKKLRGK